MPRLRRASLRAVLVVAAAARHAVGATRRLRLRLRRRCTTTTTNGRPRAAHERVRERALERTRSRARAQEVRETGSWWRGRLVAAAAMAAAVVAMVSYQAPGPSAPEDIAVAGSIRYLDTAGRPVMVLDRSDVTIIWLIDGAPEEV